ncbi:GntR family transcriptional regulator [Cellulomonas sp. DKR-3]|uniref:GntR family transcriptional regulator n=2 Tax=Cellulomonas fulva TaxID=2835530 RepID=A0ABS5TVE7_9CELL|nr:GntR family transcriptional regulator [Cellulomonas fulva]
MVMSTGPLPAADATDPATPTDGLSLREVVYQRLRDDILNGRVSPRERLTEPKLGKAFEVSRTPVREALSRLLSDGLVERTDFGYAVVVPSLEDLRNLYELRITLELRGIQRAIENPSVRHDEAALRAELEVWQRLRDEPPEPDASFVQVDERFHQVLSRSSGNAQLTDALVTVNQKIRSVRMHDFVETSRIDATITEHLEILDLVLARHLPEALTALHKHVGESLEVVMERATSAMTRMALAG